MICDLCGMDINAMGMDNLSLYVGTQFVKPV